VLSLTPRCAAPFFETVWNFDTHRSL